VGKPNKRTCIFCGSTPTSREHVIPQWISSKPEFEYIGDYVSGAEHRIKRFLPHHSGGDTVVEELRGRAIPPRDIVSKVVCKGCNSGWMNDLEAEFEAKLSPLLDGALLSLTPDQSQILACWASKTAIMYQFNDAATRSTGPRQFADLYEGRGKSVPSFMQVHIARFTDRPVLWPHQTGGLGVTVEGPRIVMHSGITSIVVGQLALAVLSSTHEYGLSWLQDATESELPKWQPLWAGQRSWAVEPHARGVNVGDVYDLAYSFVNHNQAVRRDLLR
jgi:hypothetical protein